jgi:rhomboid protease GluP
VAVTTFIAINFLVWLAMERAGGSSENPVVLAFGAKWNPAIDHGEYWRLVLPMFLHFDFMQVALSSYAILVVGTRVEAMFGHTRLIVIYLISGFSGFVFSYLRTPEGIAVGSSGAFFGVAAALVVFLLRNWHATGVSGPLQMLALVIPLALIAAYGLANPEIDNWGHLGGFAAGLAVATPICPRLERDPKASPDDLVWVVRPSRKAGWIAALLIVGLLSWAVLASQSHW